MGYAVENLEEEKPLLKAPTQQRLKASSVPASLASDPQPAGSWDGNLLQCCGRPCTGQGWVSCAFAYFLPCFAFGYNMRRAFSASLWLHAFVFFVLFYGVHRGFSAAVMVTADNCRADPPAGLTLQQPRPLTDPTPHATWLSGRKLLQIDDAPGKFAEAFADVLPSATAHAVIHGGSVDQGQTDSHSADAEHSAEVVEIDVGGLEAIPIVEKQTNFNCVRKPGSVECIRHPQGPLAAGPLPPHPAIIPFTAEFGKATPGCQRAYAGLFALFHLVVAALAAGIVFAARQRTLMRQKFMISGSAFGDFLAWCCCAPCALCQETRTLRANNVLDGQWNGRTSAVSTEFQGAVTPPKVLEV